MKVAVCLSTVVLAGLFLLWAILEMSAVSDPGDVEIYEDGGIARVVSLPAPAERIAIGPDGDLFFLSDRRWAYRIDLVAGDTVTDACSWRDLRYGFRRPQWQRRSGSQ